jgi:hypothetical protein
MQSNATVAPSSVILAASWLLNASCSSSCMSMVTVLGDTSTCSAPSDLTIDLTIEVSKLQSANGGIATPFKTYRSTAACAPVRTCVTG